MEILKSYCTETLKVLSTETFRVLPNIYQQHFRTHISDE